MAPYEPVTQEILAQLEAIAPGRVTAGEDVNPDYGRDEMPIYGVHMRRRQWKSSPRKRPLPW